MQRARARTIAALIALATVVPPSLVAIHIDRYGRNVPFWDEWGHSVPLSLKVAKGELNAADLFRQQNAHYLVFHKLTTVALTWSTRWNLKVGMYLSLAMAAGICVLAVGLYGWPPLLWFPFSLIVFSLRQRECWLWAQLDTYVFLSLSWLATLFLLARRPGSMAALATAVAVCAIGTFSAASALAAWPVLLIALPALGYRGRAHRLVWMFAGLFTLAAFFTNYRWLRTGVVTDPGFLAGFVLAYLGSPLTRFAPEEVPSAQLVTIGALLLTAGNCLYLLKTQPSVHGTRVALSLALLGLAAGCGLLTGAGRGLLGTTQALQSRYVTQASLFWLAVVGLAVLVLAEARLAAARTPARWLWIAFNGVGVAFILMRVASAGYWAAAQPPLVTERQEACVRSFPLTRDAACLHGLHPRPETLGASIDALATHRLTAFSR